MAGSFNRWAGVGAEPGLLRGGTSQCGPPLAPSPAVEGEGDAARGHGLAAELDGERCLGVVGCDVGGRDAVAQAEAEASAGHLSHRLPPRAHGHPVAGDLARPDGRAHEAPRRVVGIELAQPGCPDELPIAEPHGPAQAAAEGVDALVHILPVEPEAGLQSQRVPGTQPRREQPTPRARLEQGVPENRGGGGSAVELQPSTPATVPRVEAKGRSAERSEPASVWTMPTASGPWMASSAVSSLSSRSSVAASRCDPIHSRSAWRRAALTTSRKPSSTR